MEYRFILASASPRRQEILSQTGFVFEVAPSDYEEKTSSSKPEDYVKELAKGKAASVAQRMPGPAIFLGADTIVVCQGSILTKPADRQDAFLMLQKLQGNTHEVYTGVALYKKEENGQIEKRSFSVKTKVEFYSMSVQEIRDYLATSEYMDKAGAYAIQGRAAAYIRGIEGDYYNVVGLPISAVVAALKEYGWHNGILSQS